MGSELRESEVKGGASAEALRWDQLWHRGGTSKKSSLGNRVSGARVQCGSVKQKVKEERGPL